MTTKQQRQKLAGQIATVTSSGIQGWALQSSLTTLLVLLLPFVVADWLAMLVAGQRPTVNTGLTSVGPAQRAEEQLYAGWLTLYILAAAERLDEALKKGQGALDGAEAVEEGYFQKHLKAEERRLRAAALQDATAWLLQDRTDGLLGWRAVLDKRTTHECRWAHGKNFVADKMPSIGWPGAVHVHCRCSAGPPVPGAPLIPSI